MSGSWNYGYQDSKGYGFNMITYIITRNDMQFVRYLPELLNYEITSLKQKHKHNILSVTTHNIKQPASRSGFKRGQRK